MKSLAVRMDEEAYRKLDESRRREGYTKTGPIRRLIRSFLEESAKEEGSSFDHPFWRLVGAFEDEVGV